MRTGLDVVLETLPAAWRGARVGLLTQSASVDAGGRLGVDLLAAHRDLRLVRLFAPEHGLRGEHPAGAPILDGVDGPTGLPVVSLYRGAAGALPADAFADLSAVLIDLQDIGCRYYTFPGTARRLMGDAVRAGVPVHVLDRPNPLGGAVAGPPTVPRAARSLVAAFDVPVRHGLTLGELLLLAAEEDGLDPHAVQVHRVEGWRRGDGFQTWGRAWVPPSPNSTGPAMAELYPGTCLIEGTNLSEGRGTPYPFRQIGAPGMDGHRLAERLRPDVPAGITVRPTWFIPTASKHAGALCQGVFLDLLPGAVRAPDAALVAVIRLLQLLVTDGDVTFSAAHGTYRFDRLLGGPALRDHLQHGVPCDDLLAEWRAGCGRFVADRTVALYD